MTHRLLKRLILSAGSIYLFATILAQITSIIRIVALPYMLSPIELGLWSLFNMIIAYGANSHLGFLHGMNKLYPAMRARGESIEAAALRDSVFTICGILGLGVSLAAGVVGLFRFPDQLLCVLFVSLTIFFQSIHTFCFSLLRAENQFRMIGLILAGTSSASTCLILGLMFFNQKTLSNALAGLMLGQAFSSLVIFKLTQTKFTLVMKRRELKMAFAAGFPLIVIGFVDMLFTTIDRWILSAYAHPAEFGFYSLAVMTCGVLTMFSAVVSSFTFTRMIEFNADSDKSGEGFRLFESSHDFLALLLLVLIILLWSVAPFLVHKFAFHYAEAIPPLKVLSIGYYFLALAGTCGSYAMSCDRQKALFLRQGACFVLMLGLCFSAGEASFKLVNFGGVVSCVLFLFYVLYLGVAFSDKQYHRLLVLKKILSSGFPIATVWAVQYGFTDLTTQQPAMWGAALDSALQLVACGTAGMLTFIILNRRFARELYRRIFGS